MKVVFEYVLWSKQSDAPSEDDEAIETMENSIVEKEELETFDDAGYL